MLRSTRSMSTLFEYLLWVDPFWGRENPREDGRYTWVSKTGQRCSICHDFASLSLINVDFEETFGIPRLLLSMLAPCRIASRYSEKNPLFFSLWNVFFLLPSKCPLWDTLFWARLDQWKHDDLRMLCFSVRFGRKWAIFGPISVAKRRISSIFLLGK